ncbi:hypothetical protein [Hymenobacter terrenus]|uniref:hypothetical protein n=1 Tax=Hymenobacter terrenus TaxID=1629124 RepID=UPI0006196215|nr:hypothetical protein [Hymenobacter terrenus]
MGLTIGVNVLADLKKHDTEGYEWMKVELERVNKLLQQNNLPPHQEPETLFARVGRPPLGNFSYSWLHYLRRAVAYQINDEPLTPSTGHPERDVVLDAELCMFRSHLICHSDAEGFYLPIDFEEPLFDDESAQVAGGIVGSSFGLQRELQAVAPLLSIALPNGAPSETLAAQIISEPERGHPFWIERFVWLALYDSVKFSLRHGSAIVFG